MDEKDWKENQRTNVTESFSIIQHSTPLGSCPYSILFLRVSMIQAPTDLNIMEDSSFPVGASAAKTREYPIRFLVPKVERAIAPIKAPTGSASPERNVTQAPSLNIDRNVCNYLQSAEYTYAPLTGSKTMSRPTPSRRKLSTPNPAITRPVSP